MTTLFWALEYSKVFIAYMILIFVWPGFIFRHYLKGKSITFRFGFCSTASILIINTAVLLLGLVGLLKSWVIGILFYGSIVFSLYAEMRHKEKTLRQAGRVLEGTYGVKQFLLTMGLAFGRKLSEWKEKILQKTKGHKGEYVLLGVVLIYGMIYFSYGAFQDYSYGFGDMYPHNAWIYGLTRGEVFSAGVYPEGMHCFIYAMHELFGIRIYSCMLFTAGIHIVTFLLSAYCLLKEVFCSRYTPILALALFLTMDVVCIDEIYSMSRLQWTIPQEFGFYTLFLCGAFLARYLKAPAGEKMFSKQAEDLLVFMMALGASLTIHFYPTIMAFFLCLAFVPLAIGRLLRPKKLIPLMAAVAVGCLIAILPMGAALATGIPFQGSIGWAVNVINGTDGANQGAIVIDENTGEEITGDISLHLPGQSEQSGDSENTVEGNRSEPEKPAGQGDVTGQGNLTGQETQTVKEPFSFSKLGAMCRGLWNTLRHKANIVYWESYITLYKQDRAAGLVKMTGIAFLLFLICKAFRTVYLLVTKKEGRYDLFDGYFALTLSSVIFMVMYCAGSVGLPMLIAGSRLCSIMQLLLLAVCMIPMDVLLWLLGHVSKQPAMTKLAWAGVFAIYIGTILFDRFHGYLYYELTRYNGAVMVTQAITNQMPKYSYTIVSTVDELYPMIQYGYHEEAVQFINDCVGEDYTLPTEYVFVYVEKHPIEYAQSHFFGGPAWLACEKYPAYYDSMVSQCPDINNATISPELAEAPFYQYPVSSKAYSNLASRIVVESRLDKWCKEFKRLYPNEMHTYYEDENFICYYFKQNPARLYQLAIQ